MKVLLKITVEDVPTSAKVRRAAELLVEARGTRTPRGCCMALSMVNVSEQERSRFAELFQPTRDDEIPDTKEYSWAFVVGYYWPPDSKYLPVRLLALEFFAAILESEGD